MTNKFYVIVLTEVCNNVIRIYQVVPISTLRYLFRVKHKYINNALMIHNVTKY